MRRNFNTRIPFPNLILSTAHQQFAHITASDIALQQEKFAALGVASLDQIGVLAPSSTKSKLNSAFSRLRSMKK